MRLLLLLVLLIPGTVQALSLSERDKQYHAGASYVLTVAGNAAGLGRWHTAGAVLAIGLLKEATDTRFDAKDVQANVLGIGAATLFSFTGTF